MSNEKTVPAGAVIADGAMLDRIDNLRLQLIVLRCAVAGSEADLDERSGINMFVDHLIDEAASILAALEATRDEEGRP